MRGILDKMDEDISITRKLGNGSSVTYKSPKGSQIDMSGILGGMVQGIAPTPVADNKQINVTPGEFVVNQPAAQKYKGILERINNEGRQMLAQGGWTGKKNYFDGGSIYSEEQFNVVQEDLPYIEEMVAAGKTAYELAPEYNMNPMALKTILDDSGVSSGNFATDDTPIVSSGNPGLKAAEFAEANGLDHSDFVMETLEHLVKEAIQDWASLPEHEKAEWGSIDELIDYYMNDGATEAGLYDSHYVDDQNFAEGGTVPTNKFLTNSEFVSRVKAAIAKGLTRDQILDAAVNNPKVSAVLLTDYDTQMLEDALSELTGTPKVEGYWTGGEVGKGEPEEGDTYSTRGQTFYYRNGQWEYKGGTKAPGYAIKDLEAKANSFKSVTAPGGSDSAPTATSNVDIEKESHAKNYAWGKRAIEAEKVIRELIADGYNPASFARSKQELVAGLVGDNDLFRDEKGQRYKKAVESLVAAVLRKDTGAAIAADEFDRTYRQLFPAVGTGEKAQEDVANQRLQNIQGFIDSSGPGANELAKQADDIFKQKGHASGDIFTWEDILGAAGGLAGAIPGGVFGGPLGAAGGGAGGTYLGASLGSMIDQWTSEEKDIDLGEAFGLDTQRVIDTTLGAAGSGAGNFIWKGKKLAGKALKSYLQKKGLTAKDVTESVLDDVAKATGSKAAAQLAGQIPAEVAKKFAGHPQTIHAGKVYFIKGGKAYSGSTGKAVSGHTGRNIVKSFDDKASKLF